MAMRSCSARLHRASASAATPVRCGSLLLRSCYTPLYTAAAGTRSHTHLRSSAVGAVSMSSGPLDVQRRTQYAQMPGKREQEAFLTQFDPMEVLGLEPDCNVEDIDAAFERAKAKYGANGKCPDAKMVERVFRAHEILKDPDSPYYLKAHSSQTDRQRLQFQLLPKSKRRLIESQVALLMLLAFGVAVLVIKLVLRPMNRSMRAATR